MAQRVDRQGPHAGPLADPPEGTADVVLVQPGARRRGEYPSLVMPVLARQAAFGRLRNALSVQGGKRRRGQGEGAAATSRLGRPFHHPAADRDPIAPYRENSIVQVHVAPPEGERLAVPQPAVEEEGEEVRQALALGGGQQAVRFGKREAGPLPRAPLCRARALGRVGREHAEPDGIRERRPQDAMRQGGLRRSRGIPAGRKCVLPPLQQERADVGESGPPEGRQDAPPNDVRVVVDGLGLGAVGPLALDPLGEVILQRLRRRVDVLVRELAELGLLQSFEVARLRFGVEGPGPPLGRAGPRVPAEGELDLPGPVGSFGYGCGSFGAVEEAGTGGQCASPDSEGRGCGAAVTGISRRRGWRGRGSGKRGRAPVPEPDGSASSGRSRRWRGGRAVGARPLRCRAPSARR